MKPAPFAVTIERGAKPTERNLIVGSWRHSMADSPEGEMRKDAYRAWFQALVTHFLGSDEHGLRLPDSCELLTARRADRPDFVAGWMLVQHLNGGLAVHYANVKADYRGCGFGDLLLATAIESADGDELFYTLRPRRRVRNWFEKYSFKFANIAGFIPRKQEHK